MRDIVVKMFSGDWIQIADATDPLWTVSGSRSVPSPLGMAILVAQFGTTLTHLVSILSRIELNS